MSRLLQLLLPLFAVLLAVPLAFADPTEPGPEPAPSASASASASSAPPAASAFAAPVPALTAFTHGLAPLPDDRVVPAALLPPGSESPDTGPSTVIYPVQQITIRFNHGYHLTKEQLTCATCHAKAKTSANARDKLTPPGTTCDACHGSDHTNLSNVTAGDETKGQCAFCHVGYKAGDGNHVPPTATPRANMIFNHQKHEARNIRCEKCHGDVKELELATRDQLPRMKGCFSCHQHPDSASRGDAKSACETCHIRGTASEAGRIKTMFASGVLKPPRWLHNAAHTPDFLARHKMVAGNDSSFCSSCHTEDYCVACHDGRVRPRSIHPNDYISMHPIEARQATQKCTSCHREQSFCLDCHMRVGVSMSSPTGVRNSGRFHPPKSIWSDAPRTPGHHAYEAQRNINACVSCHIERDCVVCHGAQGIGGGFNPHRANFAAGCGTQFRRNPRPCLVCHQPSSSELTQCR